MTNHCSGCGKDVQVKAGLEDRGVVIQKAVGLVEVEDVRRGPVHGQANPSEWVCPECLEK